MKAEITIYDGVTELNCEVDYDVDQWEGEPEHYGLNSLDILLSMAVIPANNLLDKPEMKAQVEQQILLTRQKGKL